MVLVVEEDRLAPWHDKRLLRTRSGILRAV